jgi:copper chaperone CopZ
MKFLTMEPNPHPIRPYQYNRKICGEIKETFMKNMGFGVIILLFICAVTAFAGAKPTPVVLSAVTVSLQGVKADTTPAKLQKGLSAVVGITAVVVKSNTVTAKIDESKVPASQFVQVINGQLAKIQTYGKATAALTVFIDADMCKAQKKMCGGCFTEIPNALKKVSGINGIKLDDTGKIASLTFVKDAKVTTKAIKDALLKSSYGFIVTFSK